MRAAYAQALVDALRAGRVEVFSENEASFSGFQGDAAAFDVAIRALDDPKATTRRLAAEMLGRMELDSAIPNLTRLLSDPEPSVRASAVSSLGALYADSSIEQIIPLLNDNDEQVRQEVLKSITRMNLSPNSALINQIAALATSDPSLTVQTKALTALLKLGETETALANLNARLKSADQQVRISALEASAEIEPDLQTLLDRGAITNALEDPSANVRRASVLALGKLKDDSISKTVVEYLSDSDAHVRSAAAEVLHDRSEESRALVLKVIQSRSGLVDPALDALAPGNPASLSPLREYASRELLRTRRLRSQSVSLPASGKATMFLSDCLRMQAALSEGRLIKTVGLFGDTHTMELVRKSLRGINVENRAAALEALDTIGDKQLAKSVVSLLEEEPARSDPSDVIAVLLKDEDPWLRILAIRSTSELGLREFIPLLCQLESGPDVLMREAAQGALIQFGEEHSMNTLQTVSILERILLLRDIPIFAELPPEDLKLVAEIAREEWYPQNTVIFHQGDEGNIMFVIVDGLVQVLISTNAVERELAQRGPGEFVGEMAIIDSVPRLATLRTQTDVRLLAIDGDTFKGILRERPDVSFAVLRSFSRRLREMIG
jgi:HEAT repeat protein